MEDIPNWIFPVSVALVGAVVFFFHWQERKRRQPANRTSGEETKGKSWSDVLKNVFSTKPGIVVLGIVVFVLVLKINWPENYALAFGGDRWWHLIALLISAPMATSLFNKGGVICSTAGSFILLVGMSPVVTSFPLGQVIAREYSETMDMVQYGKHAKALKLGEWTLLRGSNDKMPNVFRPEKGCLAVRNTKNDKTVEYWAYTPEGDPRTSETVDSITFPVVNDVSEKVVYVLHIKQCDSGSPDRVYYKYGK